MSELSTIRMTGIAFGNEKAIVEFQTGKTKPDGVDAVVSISVLEFQLHVETFFYGFNVKTFVEQAAAVANSRLTVAKLFNYDETLALEFIRLGGDQDFVSIHYRSIAPDAPTQTSLEALRRLSTVVPASSIGSQFVLSFMRLDTSLADCASLFSDTLAQLGIATESPYTESTP